MATNIPRLGELFSPVPKGEILIICNKLEEYALCSRVVTP